jgi:hypothetical protein
LGTPAQYMASGEIVDVIDEREEMSFVKFPNGKCIWVKTITLDFDDLGGDDDWGPENDDNLGFDSPADSDEYEMNYDDCYEAGDPFDMEYDRP